MNMSLIVEGSISRDYFSDISLSDLLNTLDKAQKEFSNISAISIQYAKEHNSWFSTIYGQTISDTPEEKLSDIMNDYYTDMDMYGNLQS